MQYAQSPDLATNPERDRLVEEINQAMTTFALLKAGGAEQFVDIVGLHDDGGGEAVLVTLENVEPHEEAFRRKWSWLCPDLVAEESIEAQ